MTDQKLFKVFSPIVRRPVVLAATGLLGALTAWADLMDCCPSHISDVHVVPGPLVCQDCGAADNVAPVPFPWGDVPLCVSGCD